MLVIPRKGVKNTRVMLRSDVGEGETMKRRKINEKPD